MKKYELSDIQVKIIKGALDRHYYNCKDIGDYDQMDECIEIGKILTEQSLPEHGGDVK